MSKKDKNIIPGPDDFLKYSANKMSPEERNAFERKLQKDPFDEEAAEGFASISPEQAERDLNYLSDIVRNRTRKKEYILWYRIAASVAVLAIVSSVFFLVIKNRIDKGTGQVIISQSDQKEETKIIEPQTLGPAKPEAEKKSVSDVPGKKPTIKEETKISGPNIGSPEKQDVERKSVNIVSGKKSVTPGKITEARPARRELVPQSGIILPENVKPLNEPVENLTKEKELPLIQAAANMEIMQNYKAEGKSGIPGFVAHPLIKRTVEGIIFSSEDGYYPGMTLKLS